MIKIRGLDHIVLRVIDLEAMLHFYRDALGCPIERRQDELGLIQLRAGNALIDLVPVGSKLGRVGGAAPGAEGHNMDHLCLRLDGFDGEVLRRHFTALGYAAGEVATRYGADGEGPSLYLTDPDGNVVELKG